MKKYMTQIWLAVFFLTAQLFPADAQVINPSSNPFKASGTGAVVRTGNAKMGDIVSVLDYGTPTQAVAAVTNAGTGTILVPNNIAPSLPASFPSALFDYSSQTTFNVYNESDPGRVAKRLIRGQGAAAHSGSQVNAFGIEYRPTGSGANGAANADIGFGVSVIKPNYLTTTNNGEIDGINVAVRQGGTSGSDVAGILIDAGIANGAGFAASLEGTTTIFNSSGTTLRKLNSEIGVLDSATSTYIGYVSIAQAGAIDDGIRFLTSGTGTFTNFIRGYDNSGNQSFTVASGGSTTLTTSTAATPAGLTVNSTGSGTWTNYLKFTNLAGVDVTKFDTNGQLIMTAPSGVTPKKTIRVNSGALTVVNNADTVQIFNLADDGSLSLAGGLNAGATAITTLTATGQTSLGGSAGAESLRVKTTASAVNRAEIAGSTGSNAVTYSIAGTGTNVGAAFASKGNAAVTFYTEAFSTLQAAVTDTPSAVNYVNLTGGATGTGVSVKSDGSDTNVDLLLATKGAGNVKINGVITKGTLSGTSSSIGGGALAAGACASTTVTVTGATTSMVVNVSPSTYPGDGNYWLGYVSAADTVTVKVCAAIAGTPTASAYNVRVTQ